MLVDFPPKKSCLSSCENIRYRAQSKSNIVNSYLLSSSCSCLETGYGLVFPIPESSCRVDLFRSKTISGVGPFTQFHCMKQKSLLFLIHFSPITRSLFSHMRWKGRKNVLGLFPDCCCSFCL